MLKVFYTIILLLSLSISGFTQEQFNSEIPAAGDSPGIYPTGVTTNNDVINRILFNYRQGDYLIYNNATTLTVGPGEISCNSNTGATNGQKVVYRQNTSNTSATTANLDTGNSFTASTTYYVYASCDASATTYTVVLSLNASTPSGVTNYRLLGNFTTDSSNNIAQIIDLAIPAHFGSRVSDTVNTPYQATTDGIVILPNAYCSANGGTDNSTGYTDSSPNPTTAYAVCSSPSSSTNVVVPLIFPVRKGDYWKIAQTGSRGGTTVYFIPWGQ
jgi:hypothetical protein